MRTPLEGLKVLVRSQYGKKGYANEASALLVFGGKKYIYNQGQIMGPVSEYLGHTIANNSVLDDVKRRFDLNHFRWGKKFGVYVDGVRHSLFDELTQVDSRSGHCIYGGRRGEKWYYVIDGKIHGEFDVVNTARLWFRKDSEGHEALYYWGRVDGKESYFCNDEPLHWCKKTGHNIKIFPSGPVFSVHEQGKVGWWKDGQVLRWHDSVGGFYVPKGGEFAYVGKDDGRETYYFNNQVLGPYDDVEMKDPVQFGFRRDLAVEFPCAVFENDGKRSVLVDKWQSPWHDEFGRIMKEGEHLFVVGIDTRGDKRKLFTFYVDGTVTCAQLDVTNYSFKEGELTISTNSISVYPV